jgi:hypothetical protein
MLRTGLVYYGFVPSSLEKLGDGARPRVTASEKKATGCYRDNSSFPMAATGVPVEAGLPKWDVRKIAKKLIVIL